MKKYLDSTDKINEIKQELNHPLGKAKIWVLVEGVDDVKIYRKLIDAENVKVETVEGGISHLKTALSVLLIETKRVLGIRDADFLHLELVKEEAEALFLTDYHDIEIQMFHSDKVLKSLFNEYQVEDDINKIRSEILAAVSFLGYVRWYNNKNNYGLNFQGISFEKLFDNKTISLNQKKLVKYINERSPNKEKEIVIDDVNAMINKSIDLYQLCNGHDVIKLLRLFINFKRNNRKPVNDDGISSALRLSYTYDDFKKTKLFEALNEWELKYSCVLFGQ